MVASTTECNADGNKKQQQQQENCHYIYVDITNNKNRMFDMNPTEKKGYQTANVSFCLQITHKTFFRFKEMLIHSAGRPDYPHHFLFLSLPSLSVCRSQFNRT